MLDDLETVPWHKYRHAYGPATDVPKWLNELSKEVSDQKSNEAFAQLAHSICHQGTVYEATSYVVPFLLELVSLPNNPNKEGILALLASVADGRSYLDVHGNRLNLAESVMKAKLALELQWIENARTAVLDRLDQLIDLVDDDSERIAISSAHVLSKFPDKVELVGPILHRLYDKQSSDLYKAGCVLLIGGVRHRSKETIELLTTLVSSESEVLRVAAVWCFSELKVTPLPLAAREATIDVLLRDMDLYSLFSSLPGDMCSLITSRIVTGALNKTELDDIAAKIIDRIEQGMVSSETIYTLLQILFPMTPTSVVAEKMSELQQLAVCVVGKADGYDLTDKRRKFRYSYRQWGLPNKTDEWKRLISQVSRRRK